MDRATGQAAREAYNPINLDYIFTEPEDDPLLPWLEQREKEKDVANSEEENYPELVRKTTQVTHDQPPTFNLVDDSSDTVSDHHNESSTDSGDDSGGLQIVREFGVGSTSDTVVPSTYPQSSQTQHTTLERGKSPITEEEEEGEEEEDEEEQIRMNSMERTSPWPTGYPNVYVQPYHMQFPTQPHAPPIGTDSYTYLFGYPPQYGYGHGQVSNNNSEDNDVDEPPRHSFWW